MRATPIASSPRARRRARATPRVKALPEQVGAEADEGGVGRCSGGTSSSSTTGAPRHDGDRVCGLDRARARPRAGAATGAPDPVEPPAPSHPQVGVEGGPAGKADEEVLAVRPRPRRSSGRRLPVARPPRTPWGGRSRRRSPSCPRAPRGGFGRCARWCRLRAPGLSLPGARPGASDAADWSRARGGEAEPGARAGEARLDEVRRERPLREGGAGAAAPAEAGATGPRAPAGEGLGRRPGHRRSGRARRREAGARVAPAAAHEARQGSRRRGRRASPPHAGGARPRLGATAATPRRGWRGRWRPGPRPGARREATAERSRSRAPGRANCSPPRPVTKYPRRMRPASSRARSTG